MTMERFFYFISSDLMVRVSYNAQMNSLRYISHREMEIAEKIAVEHYILAQVGPSTGYCDRSPSLLVYVGVDQDLIKELRFHQLKSTVDKVIVEKLEIDAKVQNLIHTSLSNYYFEQIGEEIMSLRKEIEGGSKKQFGNIITKIVELVDAYNLHSNQKVTVEEVIPEELRLCLQA